MDYNRLYIFLKDNAEDSSRFISIRYLLHSLSQAKMHELILEVININPYLAVQVYLTTEADRTFNEALINTLNETRITNLHFAISYWLAFGLLGDDSHDDLLAIVLNEHGKLMSFRKYARRSKQGERIHNLRKNLRLRGTSFEQIVDGDFRLEDWCTESDYWIQLFFTEAARRRPDTIPRFIELVYYNDSAVSSTNKEELLMVVQQLLHTGQRSIAWRLLDFIDKLNLYELLGEIDIEFITFWSYLQTLHRGQLWYPINFGEKEKERLHILYKIAEIFISNHKITEGEVLAICFDKKMNDDIRTEFLRILTKTNYNL